MKSAYELAMERLEKEKPSAPPLRDEQKLALAEINNLYESKIAEAKILAEGEIKQNPASVHEIHARLKEDIRRLEAERDEKKDEIRKQG